MPLASIVKGMTSPGISPSASGWRAHRLLSALGNFSLVTVPTLLLLLVCLEIFFRWVLPASDLPRRFFDKQFGVVRFDTTESRDGLNTIGPWAEQRGRWHVNNAGWNSDIDYHPRNERHRPLVAIIGDSFIEAFSVDVDSSIATYLRQRAGDDFDVYAFGMAGAPLSQYLQMSRYVRAVYEPDLMIVNVVENDFDQSIQEFNQGVPFFLVLKVDGESVSEVAPKPYVPNRLLRMLRHSATVRGLYLNYGLGTWTERAKARRSARHDANVDVNGAAARRAKIVLATDYVVRQFVAENPKHRVVFVMDALRRDIYRGTLDRSAVGWMSRLLAESCSRHDCLFLDLNDSFAETFRREGIQFDTQFDSHWNAYGHANACDALYRFLGEHNLVLSSNKE